ncbi:MAG TPA: hypothetical protein VFM18_20835 [Methanosarcina sp.]|nr:hypothetical protein [Methanosarcina sp.]
MGRYLKKKNITSMALSSSQRVKNDLSSKECSSDKFIPPDSYFIIKVELDKEYPEFEKVVKNFLKTHPSSPLVAWCQKLGCSFLYSSTDSEHYLRGSHQEIISEITCEFCLEIGQHIKTRIIELETRTRCIIYFQTKIREYERLQMTKKSLKQKDVETLTRSELLEKLEEKGVNWETIDGNFKYGTFFKLAGGKIVTMIDSIGEVDDPKYSSYFFT